MEVEQRKDLEEALYGGSVRGADGLVKLLSDQGLEVLLCFMEYLERRIDAASCGRVKKGREGACFVSYSINLGRLKKNVSGYPIETYGMSIL